MTIEVANPRFPVGLRVLVVDDDPLCLRIVEKMLKRCQYEGAAKIFFPHALALICAIGRRPFGMRRGERARGAGEARGSAERAGTRSKRRSRSARARTCRRRGRRPPFRDPAWRGFPLPPRLSTWRLPVLSTTRSGMHRERGVTKKSLKKKEKKEAFIRDDFPGTRDPDPRASPPSPPLTRLSLCHSSLRLHAETPHRVKK